MNKKQGQEEYFELEGYFQLSGGSPIQQAISLETAVQVVCDYSVGMVRADDAERALKYIEKNVAKTGPFARAIRQTYHLDSFTDEEEKSARCGPALQGIWARIKNKPL